MQNEKGNEESLVMDSVGVGIEARQKKKAVTYRQKWMGARDIKLLKFMCEQYFMSRSQMIRWLMLNYDLKNEASAKTVMIRSLQAMRGFGLIRPFRSISLGFEEAFLITSKGIRDLQSSDCVAKNLSYTPIDEDKLRHDALVTAIRMAWEFTTPIYHWIPERVLRDGSDNEIPDAVVTVKGVDDPRPYSRIAIEIETTLKSLKRYREKFSEYDRSHHNLVIYFTDDKKIREAVIETGAEFSDKICVCSAADFVKIGGAAEATSHLGSFIIKDQFEGKTRCRKNDSYSYFGHDIDCDWAEWGHDDCSDRSVFDFRFK